MEAHGLSVKVVEEAGFKGIWKRDGVRDAKNCYKIVPLKRGVAIDLCAS